MNHFISFLVASALLVACVQSDAQSNQFVDQIVNSLKGQKNFDPLVLGEHKVNFDRQVGLTGLVHLRGELDIHNVSLTGLSHVRRIGDAKLENTNGSFSAQLHMGDSNVKADANVSVHVEPSLIHHNLRVEIDIGDVAVNFAAGLGSDGKPSLKSFDIEEFKHARFHVHGLAALDPLVDILADAFVAVFNTQARHLLTTEIRPILEAELKNFKMGSF